MPVDQVANGAHVDALGARPPVCVPQSPAVCHDGPDWGSPGHARGHRTGKG